MGLTVDAWAVMTTANEPTTLVGKPMIFGTTSGGAMAFSGAELAEAISSGVRTPTRVVRVRIELIDEEGGR